MTAGSICVFTGTVRSGKTRAMGERMVQEFADGRSWQAFRPSMDTREARALDHPAARIDHAGEILELLRPKTGLVAIDEGFMLPGLVSVARILRKKGVVVLVASISLRFDGSPFDNVSELMSYADEIRVLSWTRCRCGERASYNRALLPMEADIVPGDGERYAPQCALCFDLPLPGESHE